MLNSSTRIPVSPHSYPISSLSHTNGVNPAEVLSCSTCSGASQTAALTGGNLLCCCGNQICMMNRHQLLPGQLLSQDASFASSVGLDVLVTPPMLHIHLRFVVWGSVTRGTKSCHDGAKLQISQQRARQGVQAGEGGHWPIVSSCRDHVTLCPISNL